MQGTGGEKSGAPCPPSPSSSANHKTYLSLIVMQGAEINFFVVGFFGLLKAWLHMSGDGSVCSTFVTVSRTG